jgi:hypothetical protein
MIYKCDPNIRKCADDQDINEVIKSLNLAVYSMDKFLDIGNKNNYGMEPVGYSNSLIGMLSMDLYGTFV